MKKKKTAVALKREWLIPDGAWMRYVGLQGVYWYWLSRDVRKEEWNRWGGLCITCEKPIRHWLNGQCGHIIAVRDCKEFLKFNRQNLTIQHPHCNDNEMTPMAAALNLRNYDKRYGAGAWDSLWEMRNIKAKPYSQKELRELIESLPSYQDALKKEGGETNSFVLSTRAGA